MTAPAVTNATPQLERPAFFDGQLLAAADLNAIYDYHREMRWLHNRTLHGCGIAWGMTVEGAVGDRTVTISPGYALDCLGHDLVLGGSVVLQVPPVAGAAGGGPAFYYLTASYRTAAQLSPSEIGTGECHGEGAVRLTEAPLLRWQDPTNMTVPDLRFRRGQDIVLASVWIKSCKIAKAISAADRRDLQPATHPYIAAGRTAIGLTAWEPWSPGPGGALQGVTVRVDTSAAGFVTTPTYTSQVNGGRLLAPGVLIDGPASLSDATPTGFAVTVVLPRDLGVGGYVLNPHASVQSALLLPEIRGGALNWYVSWMGVED
jgi:hypothetical protein